MMHLPIPAGYSEPVSHPAEHSNISKLGLLERCHAGPSGHAV